jgi:hypothetical protein
MLMTEIDQCHDPKLQPGYVAQGPVYDGGCDWATDPKCGCLVCAIARASFVVPSTWRLLGKDDPEVSTDWIYAVPGGGVVGVPE